MKICDCWSRNVTSTEFFGFSKAKIKATSMITALVVGALLVLGAIIALAGSPTGTLTAAETCYYLFSIFAGGILTTVMSLLLYKHNKDYGICCSGRSKPGLRIHTVAELTT